MLMFVGTYTRHTASAGIYAFEVEAGGEDIRAIAVNPDIDNPSYLVRHPGENWLYAVNEVGDFEGETGGAISAFAWDAEGSLSPIGQQASMGADPCHLTMGPRGRYLLVSNYNGGNFASFPIEIDGMPGAFSSLVQHGGQSVDPVRQKSPHVHSITLDAEGGHAYVADLGTDEIVTYSLDRQGQVSTASRRSVRVKPGAGPRHFCFDGEDRFGYLINELDNTVISFERNDDGSLIELQTVSTLPDDYRDASYCADIHLSPDSRFLYGSNRGHDSIVVFELQADGGMRAIQHCPSGGAHPRNFALTPDGDRLFAANRDSDNIVIFRRDAETGLLTGTGKVIDVPAPSCVLFT